MKKRGGTDLQRAVVIHRGFRNCLMDNNFVFLDDKWPSLAPIGKTCQYDVSLIYAQFAPREPFSRPFVGTQLTEMVRFGHYRYTMLSISSISHRSIA